MGFFVPVFQVVISNLLLLFVWEREIIDICIIAIKGMFRHYLDEKEK